MMRIQSSPLALTAEVHVCERNVFKYSLTSLPFTEKVQGVEGHVAHQEGTECNAGLNADK